MGAADAAFLGGGWNPSLGDFLVGFQKASALPETY